MRRAFPKLLVVAAAIALLNGCGGDDAPDSNGDLSAKELAAKLPDGGTPQAVAVDVSAAKEAAGVPSDSDPLEPGTDPGVARFNFSSFFALRDLLTPSDNPVRAALDHSVITTYAAHPYVSDDAVTLLSTSQDFEEIASSLEDDGWERDGDVISTDGDPEVLSYTAVAAGDEFIALGYTPEAVEAVAAGDAEPSDTGELEALEELEAPVVTAVIPDAPDAECITEVSFEDFVDGTANLFVTIDGEADTQSVSGQFTEDSASIGFDLASTTAEADTVTFELSELEDSGAVNSPAVLVAAALDENRDVLYDCG